MSFIKTVSEHAVPFPPPLSIGLHAAHLTAFEEVKTSPMCQIITVCKYSEEINTDLERQ